MPLRWVAAAYGAEVAWLLPRGAEGGAVAVVFILIYMLAIVGGSVRWVRRQPHVLDEVRTYGPNARELRQGRRRLVFLIVVLLLSPFTALMG